MPCLSTCGNNDNTIVIFKWHKWWILVYICHVDLQLITTRFQLLSIYKYISWESSVYLLDINGDWLRRFFGRDRKILGPVSQQVWHDKDPPCSKAVSSERRPKFCSPSSTMVTSPYERNTRKRNVKQKTNKQNCFNVLHYAEIVWTWIQSKYWKLSNEVTISFILQNMKMIQLVWRFWKFVSGWFLTKSSICNVFAFCFCEICNSVELKLFMNQSRLCTDLSDGLVVEILKSPQQHRSCKLCDPLWHFNIDINIDERNHDKVRLIK